MKLVINLNHRLSCWYVSERHVKWLNARFPDLDVVTPRTRGEIAREVVDADIFYGWDIEDEWFLSAPGLKWVSTPAAGLEWIVCQSMLDKDVPVTNSSFHGKIISESVIGMMLFFERGLGRRYLVQRNEPWRVDDIVEKLGSLRNKTLLIVGAGNIGGEIAKKAQAFDMKVIGIRRNPVGSKFYDAVCSTDRLDQWLKQADHVVLALPGSDQTDNIIAGEQFSLMKSGAFIYNVGRGNAIDEKALADALEKGEIAGAGLDVFAEEPLPMDSRLRKLDNVLITPHSSAISGIYLDLAFEEFAENLKRYMSGDELVNVVTKDAIKAALDRKSGYDRIASMKL
jgi:phosphoglycerate dehydrogenase-like enzyme